MTEQPAAATAAAVAHSFDRRLYLAINGRYRHSPAEDRYLAAVSDLGEGLGWVAAGIGIAWMGGRKGVRAGVAVSLASLGTTYVVQRWIKPVFRRKRPFIDREDAIVVGLRPTDQSFPSGHTASSFAAATALAAFYPRSAPLAYSVATGIGLSRVRLGAHFPSDVAVGAIIGLGFGGVIGTLLKSKRLF